MVNVRILLAILNLLTIAIAVGKNTAYGAGSRSEYFKGEKNGRSTDYT